MEIATIGFTRTSARSFFQRLKDFRTTTVLDVRLHNRSQLAAFAKRDDLAYFLESLSGADYLEVPGLAPDAEMLRAYRSGQMDWDSYSTAYTELLAHRDVAAHLDCASLDRSVLLCSEATADRCHRRLAAEYLQGRLGNVKIRHL